jgi:6-phosphogluconolactonase (cycloisomerase 2 family)
MMLSTSRATRPFAVFAILSALTACGGGGGAGSPPPPPPPPPATFTVTATVTGLTGTGLTLLDNGGDAKAVTANGSVTFATALANAATYAVTVGTQPATPAQTCTVTSGSGTIAGANITNVLVNCALVKITIGGTVSGLSGTGLQIQNNAGDTLSVTQNGSFTFATSLGSGANYAITVSAIPSNPIQQCAITNGSGTTGNANVTTAAIVCTTQAARTAVTLNFYGGSATGYDVDAASGQLRLANRFKLGTAPITFVGDKAGKFVFFLNQGISQSAFALPPVPAQPQSSISVFALDPVTRFAREISGSPFATKSLSPAATGLAILPGDAFIYVTNTSLNTIEAFSISATGALTAVTGSPFSTGPSSLPNPITFDSAGHFAYVSSQPGSLIFVYSVNSTTGALTQIGSVPTGGVSPSGLVSLSADGKFAYVLNGAASISAFSINSSSGALTAVAGSPSPVPPVAGVGTNPALSLILNPNGKALYIKNDGGPGTASLTAFSINSATGALAPLSGSPFTLGTNASGLAGIDPAGRFLYVANQGTCTAASSCSTASTGSISAFSLDAAGVPTALAGLPAVTPPPFQVSVDPSGRFLYQANVAANEVTSYSIDQTSGALTKLPVGGLSRSGAEPVFTGAFVSPTNSAPFTFAPKFAYVPNAGGTTISTYSSDPATGILTAVGSPFTSGVSPQAVAVSPRGDVAFVASAGPTPMTTAGTVSAYAIDATTGALSGSGGALATGLGPASLATDRTGRFLYVANAFDGTISSYSVDPTSGALTTAPGAPTTVGFNPIGVVVDPTGQNLYALGVDRVAVYELDAISGAITLSQVTFPGFPPPSPILLPASGASQIIIDPSGNFAYISNSIAKTIAVYQIDPYAGVLTNPQSIITNRANTSIAIDPSGRFAYTADFTDNTVSAYSVNQTTGALTLIGAALPVGANALAVTTDFSGKFVYVVLTNKTVLTFAIGGTGALTAVAGGSVATGNGPGPITAVGAVH